MRASSAARLLGTFKKRREIISTETQRQTAAVCARFVIDWRETGLGGFFGGISVHVLNANISWLRRGNCSEACNYKGILHGKNSSFYIAITGFDAALLLLRDARFQHELWTTLYIHSYKFARQYLPKYIYFYFFHQRFMNFVSSCWERYVNLYGNTRLKFLNINYFYSN